MLCMTFHSHDDQMFRKAGGTYELIKDKHGFVLGGMEGTVFQDYELQMDPEHLCSCIRMVWQKLLIRMNRCSERTVFLKNSTQIRNGLRRRSCMICVLQSMIIPEQKNCLMI